jgi:hypothetical protein
MKFNFFIIELIELIFVNFVPPDAPRLFPGLNGVKANTGVAGSWENWILTAGAGDWNSTLISRRPDGSAGMILLSE